MDRTKRDCPLFPIRNLLDHQVERPEKRRSLLQQSDGKRLSDSYIEDETDHDIHEEIDVAMDPWDKIISGAFGKYQKDMHERFEELSSTVRETLKETCKKLSKQLNEALQEEIANALQTFWKGDVTYGKLSSTDRHQPATRVMEPVQIGLRQKRKSSVTDASLESMERPRFMLLWSKLSKKELEKQMAAGDNFSMMDHKKRKVASD